ncbi:hypothetical protein BUALT_BualtUnG0016500 [Buddleja alternifolia]|uniref:Helicase C-terminal domain-containing protein n=1 Tax=Buddleja alternifolia TaxID=168488 RepID=A0AAV6W5L3_9LAMI|nr:hypothetical protein BUALT_BualtUnG0016500 [Buddleja alternifolia]
MFNRVIGPDIRKFIGPLKNHASKAEGSDLVDEDFQGITHLLTSTLHKNIANARHDFIKLSVNYHGEVPAEQRFENQERFKSNDGDCPTLVCTDLAARGLDLDVNHVIRSITCIELEELLAWKVTSLVARKDVLLATSIEEAMIKNESDVQQEDESDPLVSDGSQPKPIRVYVRRKKMEDQRAN